jgi:hypothetical protein
MLSRTLCSSNERAPDACDTFMSRSLLQRRDGGQLLALEKLEKRAATGRDVRDVVADAELLDGRERVAAAGDRESLARGDGPRATRRVPAANSGFSNTPSGAVPNDRAGALQALGVELRRLGAMSRIISSLATSRTLRRAL